MPEVSFSKLNKLTAKSFNDQKAIIKKVLLGRAIQCSTCSQILTLIPPKNKGLGKIGCKSGCTDIELDMS